MTTLPEMRERLKEVQERLKAIHAEFGERSLDEEHQTEWDGLETELDSLRSNIEKAEKRAATMAKMVDTGEVRTERGSDTGAPAFIPSRDNIYDTETLRRDARDEEHYGDLLRDNAMRAIEKARYSGIARKADAQERAEHLLDNVDNERGDIAKRLLVTGSPVYERAFAKTMKALNTNGLTGEEARAMSLGVDADGGYAVPFQLDPSVILTNNGATNPLREMARIETIVGKEWQGVTSAGITVSRDAEASEVSDDSPTLAQPTVKAERVAGFVPFSVELDMDWTQFRGEVSRMLADARDREEATSFVTGTGVSPAANGIIATLTGNTVSPTTNDKFNLKDIYKLEAALAPRWRTPAAQFLAHHSTYNAVRDLSGDVHSLWERIGAGQPAELLGYQARESSAMTAVTQGATDYGADAEKILLFGDFSNFLIVDRVGMSVELVPHLFGSNRRPTGQRGIYAIWRNNSKILVDAAFKLLVL